MVDMKELLERTVTEGASQSANTAHPSNPHRYGTRNRLNAKSVDCPGSRGRRNTPANCDSITGATATGTDACRWML